MLTRMSAFISDKPLSLALLTPANSQSRGGSVLRFTLIVLLLTSCSETAKPIDSAVYATQGLYSAALSEDGSQVVVGSINHGGSLWSTENSERLYNWNHRNKEFSQITSIRYSEDQHYVVTAGPQSLVLWNAKSGEGDALWSTYSEIQDMAVIRDADYAVLALADHSAKLFDLRRGGTLRVFDHQQRVNSVDVHSDRNLVVTGSEDHSVKLWPLWQKKAQTGEQSAEKSESPIDSVMTLQHSEPVQIVRFSPSGEWLFSMAKYDGAKIWRVDDGQLIGELPLGNAALKRGTGLKSARFSKDGRQLLTGSVDREIKLWDVASQTLVKTWRTPKRKGMDPQGTAVLDVAFLDSGFSAVTSDGIRHLLN